MKGWLVALVVVCLWQTPVRATVLYVGQASASDVGNCQSPSTPCATLGYAVSQSASGDTVLIADKSSSVWAWNAAGVHHLVAANGQFSLAKSYTADAATGFSQGHPCMPRRGEPVTGLPADAGGR